MTNAIPELVEAFEADGLRSEIRAIGDLFRVFYLDVEAGERIGVAHTFRDLGKAVAQARSFVFGGEA